MNGPFDAEFFRRVEKLQLVFRKKLAGLREGEIPSGKRGGAVEFADRRTYSPGDEFRHVDWTAYLRTERLFVKEFTKEEAFAAVVLMDCSASMTEKKLFQAKRIAGALAYLALGAGHRVSVECFADVPLWHRAKTIAEAPALLKSLEREQARGQTCLDKAVSAAFEELRLPGLAAVVSDLLWEGRGNVIGTLRAAGQRGHDVVVIHVLSRAERSPEVAGQLRLRDLETGEKRPVVLDDVSRRTYLVRIGEFIEGWRRAVEGTGGRYYLVEAEEPFERVVAAYLRDGGLLR